MEERKQNKHFETVTNQMEDALFNLDETQIGKIIVAYEPVWAIGTGITATSDMISEALHNIRNILYDNGLNGKETSILYGGSVSDENASELSAINDVDGFLVGGASLDVNKFYSIYNQL